MKITQKLPLLVNLAAFLALLHPYSSLAQECSSFDSGNVAAINNIAAGFGTARVVSGEDGHQVIRAEINGGRYAIDFWDCDSAGCRTMILSTWWDLSEPWADWEGLNAYNRDATFGRAYIDHEGDLVVEMSVNLAYGVSRENLIDTFDWWGVILEGFGASVLGVQELATD